LRDEVVKEIAGVDVDYFELKTDDEKKCVRRLAVQRYLNQGPKWFRSYLEWAGKCKGVEEGEKEAAKSFANDLIASRMATIWKNQYLTAKRKWLTENERTKKQLAVDMDKPAKRQRTVDPDSKQMFDVCGAKSRSGVYMLEKPQSVLHSQSEYSNSQSVEVDDSRHKETVLPT